MTVFLSLPLAHHLGTHRLGNLVDIRHLEDARRHEDNLAAAHEVAAAEAEIDGPPGNARGALEPLSKLGATHELGAERYRRMGPADTGDVARACPHHHVRHGDQQPAMRPAHRVAVAGLERPADSQPIAFGLEPERPDQADEVITDVELAEAFGDQLVGHVESPSLEAANFSSAARTTGSNGTLRWVSSLSDTMIAFSAAVQLPSPSNTPCPIPHLLSCTSSWRTPAVARPG